MKTLYAFRHGETDWNRDNRLQGSTDIPLNETGRKQAERLRKFFDKNPVEVVVSSDLTRAVDTAKIAMGGKNVPFVIEPRLRETRLGDAEGLTHEQVIERLGADVWEGWRSSHQSQGDFRFPGGGESKGEHLARMLEALTEFVAKTPCSRIAVSTHGGALRRLIHHWRPELTEPFMVGNCVLFEIKFEKGLWKIDLEDLCTGVS